MTIAEIYTRFVNTLIDKYGDASIEDFEFTETFNRASLAVLSDQFNNKNKRGENGVLPYAFEMSQTDLHKWKSLIQPVTVRSDNTGKITDAIIEEQLTGSKKLFHINTPLVYDESDATKRKARYVRHNDYAQIIGNVFTKPKVNRPIWLGYDGYVQVLPEQAWTATFTVTRYPKKVKLDLTTPTNNVNPDLGDSAINDVLVRMEQYYAIKIREVQLNEAAMAQENKQ